MTHPKKERTLVIIKPDGVQRSLIGEIIKRYERIGIKLIALKLVKPSVELVEKHYQIDPHWVELTGHKFLDHAREKGKKVDSDDPIKVGKKILHRLSKYMTSGPVIVMVWQGLHVIPIIRKITGGTEPLSSDVGTIRGDFVLDSYEFSDLEDRSIRNLVHASSSVADAEKEIKLWFKPEEILHYNIVQEKILYDVNLDGIYD